MIKRIRFVSFTATKVEQAEDSYLNKLGFHVIAATSLPASGSNQVFSMPIPDRTQQPISGVAFHGIEWPGLTPAAPDPQAARFV